MYDLLQAKAVDKEEATLHRPNEILIKAKGEEKPTVYKIEKGASKFLYKQLDISNSLSKELFKINETYWRQLIDYQLDDREDRKSPFKLTDSNVRYVVDNENNLIDMGYMTDDYYEDFKSKLETFLMEINSTEHTKKFYSECSGGTIRTVLYRADANLIENDFTPIVAIEVNNVKAEYSIYTGILIYNTYTLIPSMNPVSVFQSFIDFIEGVNILGTLELSEESAEGLYEAYEDFKTGHTEISARELIKVLNKVGYKLNLKDDASLDDIDKLRDENSNSIIKAFFNSFKTSTGETAEDILNLSEVKKIFKYNKLTIIDLLEILSKEYIMNEDTKITTQILSDLIFSLYTKRTDVIDAKGIIDDINNR